MKLLLDTCMCGAAKATLTQAGHDVFSSADLPEDPGDLELLELANREGRVLVTLDRDFGELAIVRGIPHRGIIRLVDVRSTDQGRAVLLAIARYHDALATGAIVTVESGRVRFRPGGAA